MAIPDPALPTPEEVTALWRGRGIWLVALVGLGFPAVASAQTPVVVPRTAEELALDGRVDESLWEGVAPLAATRQWPSAGGPASERTEFRLTYDDRFLYFSCRNFDSDPSGIRGTSLRRDVGSFSNDWCVVAFDTFNDKENLLVFGVSAVGVRTDAVFANDGEQSPNFTWNTFWDAAVSRDGAGWQAEIRIPFSSIRFTATDGRVVMGMSAFRRIARKNEMVTYPAISSQWGVNSVFKASQTQEVAFEGVYSRRPLYVTPYALGGFDRSQELNGAGTAYVPDDDRVGEGGLDVKYGLTENLTMDLTVNTDFAQVEADDQQVNLTRFSLFFPEKRLFFQERAAVFDFSLGGQDRVFYSRRIGLESGAPTRIYGGARIVGRVGEWDVGVLDIHADLPETGTGSTNFGVLRLRRRILNDNSYVGGIVTTNVRPDGEYNVAYGADAIVRVSGQDFLTASIAQTHDEGDPAGVRAAERSFGRVRWERRGEDGLTYEVEAARAGEEFNPDVGFLRRRGFTRIVGAAAYRWRMPGTTRLLRHGLGFDGSVYVRNRDKTVETAEATSRWAFDLRAGHELTFEHAVTYDDVDRRFAISDETDVPVGRYTFHIGAIRYNAPNSHLIRPNVTLRAGSYYDGWRVSGSVRPTWNVSKYLELSGSYSVDRVWFPGRDQTFTAHLARVRTQVTATSKLNATAFVQYNSAGHVVVSNLRIRYNPREGTDLYLVVNEGRNTDRLQRIPTLPLVQTRTLLVKYSYTFNLTR